MPRPIESSELLVASSATTRSWLEILRIRLPRLDYRESKHWASFRDASSGTAIAYINPGKGSMRLFLSLAPEDEDYLQPSPSSKGWGKRFPSVFSIKDETQLETAVALIEQSLNDERSAMQVDIETEEMADDAIDLAILENRLRIGVVPTDTEVALVRQRKGQERVRRLTLLNYGSTCALCDVDHPSLLVASHIVGWADAPEARGILSNVICLCCFHDALFDRGFWSLTDDLDVIRKSLPASQTLEFLLRGVLSFRRPQEHRPAPQFVRQHRLRWGFEDGQ